MAVDVAPYDPEVKGVDWQDWDSFYLFAGFVKGIAASKGIQVRWGGDWDSDWQTDDQKFNDLVHFELIG